MENKLNRKLVCEKEWYYFAAQWLRLRLRAAKVGQSIYLLRICQDRPRQDSYVYTLTLTVAVEEHHSLHIVTFQMEFTFWMDETHPGISLLSPEQL